MLESLRAMEVTTMEGRNLSKVLEARHGPGFWEPGLAQGSDQDFLDRLIACGRKYALSIVGGVWKAHIYKEYKLQLAYIHEYFRARAKTVENELQQLHELADLPQEWRDFFDKVQENGQVKITDLAGGPGCCAFGASHFFHELEASSKMIEIRGFIFVLLLPCPASVCLWQVWNSLSCERLFVAGLELWEVKLNVFTPSFVPRAQSATLRQEVLTCAKGIRSAVTVLDPVEDWAWCSEELGFEFKVSSTLSRASTLHVLYFAAGNPR